MNIKSALLLSVFCASCLTNCTELKNPTCEHHAMVDKKYLFYDVNPGEGFNLRRDVYMRIAILVKNLREHTDWLLVLPPWAHLSHWRTSSVGQQKNLPWGRFFNLESLNSYTSVVEMQDLTKGKTIAIDHILYLQNFKDAWENGKWEEKYKFESCHESNPYVQLKSGKFHGKFWGNNIEAHNFSCLSFQGHAKKIIPVLISLSSPSTRKFMIDRAETLLHDDYGNVEYWRARRSMRFAPHLYSLALEFRKKHFFSDDISDATELPSDWREETEENVAIGGNYICAHLRRRDFLYARPDDVPSLRHAAGQLRKIAKATNLTKVFIASDGIDTEMDELRRYLLTELKVFFYRPSQKTLQDILDGGAAIVEQIICSRARYFIGTHESTFSLRIQEEREILNFPSDTTFNRFCGDKQLTCEQPAKWKIRRG